MVNLMTVRDYIAISLVSVAFIHECYGGGGQCPPGWTTDEWRSRCVTAMDLPLNNSNAISSCRSCGGDLIRIEDQVDQYIAEIAITNHYPGVRSRYFIDMNDKETTNVWKFGNGDDVSWFYWESGQPNGYQYEGGQHCVVIDTKNMKWHDIECADNSYYICARRINETDGQSTQEPTTALEAASTPQEPTTALETTSTPQEPTTAHETTSTPQTPTTALETTSTPQEQTTTLETTSTPQKQTTSLETTSTPQEPTTALETTSNTQESTTAREIMATTRESTTEFETISTTQKQVSSLETTPTTQNSNSTETTMGNDNSFKSTPVSTSESTSLTGHTSNQTASGVGRLVENYYITEPTRCLFKHSVLKEFKPLGTVDTVEVDCAVLCSEDTACSAFASDNTICKQYKRDDLNLGELCEPVGFNMRLKMPMN